MKLKRIYIENYKTYKNLDLNLEVTDDRPIILIGGANGCGKTTLFDAIYHALYGLKIPNKRAFEEVFNSGVKNERGMDGKNIVLEVSFSGVVLGQETPYKLRRSYQFTDGRVLESVVLNMNGNSFVYGTGSTAVQRSTNEAIVNKIISANLPAELSNYFLFDAMKTSDLVKEEQINKLIMKNINSVMGFNKYTQLQTAAASFLAEKKAERLENENLRAEYTNLTKSKVERERELTQLNEAYSEALNYANDRKQQYEQLKEGRNSDEVIRDKMRQIEEAIRNYYKKEKDYRQDAEALSKDLELKVIMPKLASIVRTEVELILNEKDEVASARSNILNDEQIRRVTRNIIDLIEDRYRVEGKIDVDTIVGEIKRVQDDSDDYNDKYGFLNEVDTQVLKNLVQQGYSNPFTTLDERRVSINQELEDMPKREKQLEEYTRALTGSDYSIIELYEANDRKIEELKGKIAAKKNEIKELEKKISTYDYDMPQVPDPQYDMLCKLPDFFKTLSKKLLNAKKASIERMMKEQLNINLVIYAGYIGRVELSADDSEEISFKIFHKNGNEIYLSQLNAGAKQTVMQVLLKVLYELGDYDPPVMIDTVMGVLDKESRDVIINKYFPDLAHQTILLSTDTEITTENDFKKIMAYVARTYTLHRNQEEQCTTISEDYFGLQTYDF
ncbi:MAG: AAA family ATPase [Bacteroidales bacterium]|nr:AAA family ATPase [Bacteroidales bacterium]